MIYTWDDNSVEVRDFEGMNVQIESKERFKESVEIYERVMGEYQNAQFDKSQELPTVIINFIASGKKFPFVMQYQNDGEVLVAEPVFTDAEAMKHGTMFFDFLYRVLENPEMWRIPTN